MFLMNRKTIKRKFIKLLLPALYHTKVHNIFKIAYSGMGSILMFHRVQPKDTRSRIKKNSELEVTPEFLEQLIKYFSSAGREFISLNNVYDRLHENKSRKKFLAVTFDDGYADNLIHAFPILKKYNIPCTIYVSTNYPDRKVAPWWYALEDLLLKNDFLKFNLEKKKYKFTLRTLLEKEDAYKTIAHLLTNGPEGDSPNRINEFFSSFDVDLQQLTGKLLLSWEQIIKMSKDPIIDFGAHTINHFALNKLSKEEIKYEVLESKKRIESKIQRKVDHFSYPFGSCHQVNDREFAIIKECGFKTATTTRRGNIFPVHKNHFECLPRINVNEKMYLHNAKLLSLAVNGVIPCLANKFKRVVTV
jgi:peptidoglycan/xylan/chitin deacetylase (PgdA/CDA1 family)